MDRVKHTLAYERLEDGTARTTISETCCGPRMDEYDSRGVLTGQEDALGNRTSFVIDESFRLVSRTDRNGHTTTAEYGPAGHPTKVTDPMGNVTRYEYANEYGFLTAVVDALGRRTSLQYDGSGNAVGVTDAAGGSWRLGRDGWGQVRERVDAIGNRTGIEEDVVGNVISVTDPLGHKTSWAYNPKHEVTSRTDAKGQVTSFTRDDRGLLVEIRHPDGATDRISHDEWNRVVQRTDPLGHSTVWTFDDADRLITRTDPLNAISRYSWDVPGNLLSETDSNGNVTRHEYDALNRRVRTYDPLSRLTRREFDPEGNLIALTDPAGFITRRSFDANDRLVEVVDAKNNRTQVGYDAVGNRISETDANGHTTTLGYDSLNHRVSLTDPLNRTRRWRYDGGGNMVGMVNARGTETDFEYDSLGRTTRRANPDTDDRWSFDELGNVIRTANANEEALFSYDSRSRMTESRYPALNMRFLYGYDLASRLLSLRYPAGETVSYDWDAADRVTGVTDSQSGKITLGYDAGGRQVHQSWPNGLSESRTYDAASQLLSIDPGSADPKGPPSIHYTYDSRGNRLTMDRSDVGLSQYSYDELSQLLTAKLPDGDLQTYSFDPVGNRLSLQDRRGLQRYRYDSADQLLDVESDFNPEEPPATPASLALASAAVSDASHSRPLFRTSYTFDSDGNEIGKTGPGHRATSYAFNALDRLVGVDSPGSAPVRYGYNADGQRVATVKGKGVGSSDSERFLRYGRGRPVLAELSDGKITTRYIVLPGGQLLARVGPVDSKPVFYHFDALGSTVAQSDSSARIVTRFTYDPYGARHTMPVSDESMGYVGGLGVVGANAGVLEMGARFYDPALGRFVGRDPLEEVLPLAPGATEIALMSAGGVHMHRNAYSYCRNNPISRNDPSGLTDLRCKFCLAAIRALALAWDLEAIILGEPSKEEEEEYQRQMRQAEEDCRKLCEPRCWATAPHG